MNAKASVSWKVLGIINQLMVNAKLVYETRSA